MADDIVGGLPLIRARCACTVWQTTTAQLGKKCISCGEPMRRLDVVDTMCLAGKKDELTMAHFAQAEREREQFAAELADLEGRRGK